MRDPSDPNLPRKTVDRSFTLLQPGFDYPYEVDPYLTSEDVHFVKTSIQMVLALFAALQLAYLIVCITVWNSWYLFILYGLTFLVEWGGVIYVISREQTWSVEEIGGYNAKIYDIGSRFYLCVNRGNFAFLQFTSLTWFLFWLYVIYWLRPLFLEIDVLSVNGVSSCTKADAQFAGATAVSNPNGYFPNGGRNSYVLGDTYLFCPFQDVRWGSNNDKAILGFDKNVQGTDLDMSSKGEGVFASSSDRSAYPNPGLGIENMRFLISEITDNEYCPGVLQSTPNPDANNVDGLGRLVCSHCLIRERQDLANSPIDGYAHCSFDPNQGTSFFCNFCPGIWINEPEKRDPASIEAMFVVTTVVTFLPLLRTVFWWWLRRWVGQTMRRRALKGE